MNDSDRREAGLSQGYSVTINRRLSGSTEETEEIEICELLLCIIDNIYGIKVYTTHP